MPRKLYLLVFLLFSTVFVPIIVNVNHSTEFLQTGILVNQENLGAPLIETSLYLDVGVKATKIVVPVNLCKFEFQFKISQIAVLTTLQKTKKLGKNSVRDQIYALIIENPGIWFREICRSLGKAIGVVQYHLYILSSAGLIFSVKRGKYKCFFPSTYRSNSPRKLFGQTFSACNNKS